MSKTYAEHIAEELNGKLVEILVGESYEELVLDQVSSHYPAVIVGKIVGAFGNMLVLDCLYIDKSKKISHGKKIYLNDYCIKILSEVDDKCVLEDLLLRGNDTRILNAIRNRNEPF